MKRKRPRPLAWLLPLALAILTAVFAFLLTRPRPVSAVPQAAIIIDDIGYSLEAVESAYAVGLPLTVAILPDAD